MIESLRLISTGYSLAACLDTLVHFLNIIRRKLMKAFFAGIEGVLF
jgi:hypothetical protein